MKYGNIKLILHGWDDKEKKEWCVTDAEGLYIINYLECT